MVKEKHWRMKDCVHYPPEECPWNPQGEGVPHCTWCQDYIPKQKCIYSKVCEKYPNCPKGKGDRAKDYSCWIPIGLPQEMRWMIMKGCECTLRFSSNLNQIFFDNPSFYLCFGSSFFGSFNGGSCSPQCTPSGCGSPFLTRHKITRNILGKGHI